MGFHCCDAIKYTYAFGFLVDATATEAAVLILCVLILQTMFLIAIVGGTGYCVRTRLADSILLCK